MIETLEARLLLAATGPRQMEYLDRGVVATRASTSNVFVSWRSLALDPVATSFNLYRSTNGGGATKLNASPLTAGTNYTDTNASTAASTYSYFVRPVVGGVEQAASPAYTLPANSPTAPFFTLPLRNIGAYAIKHMNMADLNGDGRYDYIVDRKPINVTNEVATESSKVEAYLSDGTFLWSVDLGPGSYDLDNIEPGPTAVDIGNWDGVVAYDLDLDGKSEVFLRTANGFVFGDGATLSYPSNNDVQFLSALDGMTGVEQARIQIPTDFLADGPLAASFAVGYLDGVRPSLVAKMKNRIGSGNFNEMFVAYDFNGVALSQKWKFISAAAESDNGHNIRVVDVDGDGFDDIADTAKVIRGPTGTLKYSMYTMTPHVGHGDRFYIGDFDPVRPGLEYYGVQQNNPNLMMEYYADAATGQLLYATYGTSVSDNGRGEVGDIDASQPGAEFWSFYGLHNVYNSQHTQLGTASPWPSLGLQWDGDVLAEVLNTDHANIDQWNPSTKVLNRVASLESGTVGAGLTTADGWPIYFGDVIGDWREEVVYEKATHDGLVVFSTNTPTSTRLYTLSQNPLYRNNMTTKGYAQTRNTDYFLGSGMATPPTPNIQIVPPPNTSSNAAPTVATPAKASATIVAGTSVNLAVLGADDGGEGNLTYIWWSTGGGGPVTFAANNTNAAKNTTATFSAAGTYTLTATIRDAGGKTTGSSVTVQVVQSLTGIGVTPNPAPVQVNATQQFSATAVDQFGDAMSNPLTYSWLVTGGGGAISSAGMYTAPAVTGTATVQAQAGSLYGSATITISPITDVYQAEAATAVNVTIDTNASGYNGTGFANFPGSGGSLTWNNVDGGAGGATNILFRYSMGAGGVRTGRVTVNGVAQQVAMSSTGSWSGWTTVTVPVTLTAGATNAIKLESTGQDLGNVDELRVQRGNGFNQVPTIATPAGASPNPATGTTANLSVLGADDGGEPGLTYTWAATGPGAVTFSANGTNAAKNATATFSTPGTYTFAVTVRDAAGLTNTSTVHVDVNANPRAWWKLDETSGATVFDSSGNGSHGTAANSPAWTGGKLGNALSFDGVNDYVDLPSGIASSAAGSVSMWVKTGSNFADAAHLFYLSPVTTGNGGGAENELHVNLLSDERLQFYIKGPASNGSSDVNFATAASYADNAWHHVAATWDVSGYAMLYVDGVQVGSSVHEANVFTGSAVVRLGRPATSTRYYSGLMDDVRLFNAAIGPAQVRTMYEEGVAGVAPGVYNGTGQADNFYLKRNGANLDIWTTSAGLGAPAYSFPYTSVASLVFNGIGGDDRLTVDASAGNPIPAGGVSFDGGDGGGDTLAVIATAGDDAFTFDATSLIVGGSTVSHAAVERRLLSGNGGADSLAINAGSVTLSGALRTSALTVAPGATLDITDKPLVLENSSVSAVQSLVGSGFANGSWLGTGLTSSSAAADPAHRSAVGFADNATLGRSSFGGLDGLSGDEILVKYNYYGDADLSGDVTLDDFTLFLNGYRNAGTTWRQGDFDFSGGVTLDDFTMFLAGYQNQGQRLN